MARNIMKVKETKDRYDVTYMAGDDSGFDMMEGALLVLDAMNLPINWHRADLGWCMWEKSNKKFGEGDPRCTPFRPKRSNRSAIRTLPLWRPSPQRPA